MNELTPQQRYYQKNIEIVKQRIKQSRELKKQAKDIPVQPSIMTDIIVFARNIILPNEKYIHLTPVSETECVPVFFVVKSIETDGIMVENVNCRLLKKGTGEAIYKPEWSDVLRTNFIKNEDLLHLIAFDENRPYYGKTQYLVERIAFYKYYKMQVL